MVEEVRPYIIVIGSPKGGCGKTLTTILLAGEFAAGDLKVLVIDTDPQKSAMQWFSRSKANDFEMKNIRAEAIEDAAKLAERLENPGDVQIILVDIQGSAAAAAGSAVPFADFVIIPMRAHSFDVDGAVTMAAHVRLAGGRQRKIPFGIMLNAVGGIDAKTMPFKLAMERIAAENLKLMNAFLSNRPTFQMVAIGGTLYETDGDNKAIRDARDQTNALAAEVITKINEEAA